MLRTLGLIFVLCYTTNARDLDAGDLNEFTLSKWIDPPVSPKLKIYVFNFTNPDEFLAGAKPKFEELGPYVFTDDWQKSNIEWKNGDNSIEYNQLRYFKFLPKESKGQLRDQVVIPNIPMISALNAMKFGTPLVRRALGPILNVLKQERFLKATVRKVLFGLANPLIKLGNDVLPPEKKYPYQLFGLFVGRNATARGAYEAKTGINNREETGQFFKFKGKTRLDWWSGDKCNEIKGTDGFIYKPNIKKSDILHVFNRDFCRSIPLKFDKEITDPHGIPGYRFVPTSNAFGTPKENPDNACYCNNPGGCPDVPSGVFNVSICQFGSPVMLSWPHFFQADTKLLEAVEGLKPNKNDHQFYIDAQPKTGSGLGGKIRSQVNIMMNKIDGVKAAEGLRDILLPVMWFSDEVDKFEDPELIQRIKDCNDSDVCPRTAS